MAEAHRTTVSSSKGVVFFPRLQENMAVLRQAHRYIGSQAATGYDISPAAEWLLDNFHLIEAQVKEIHDGLPRRFFLDLPVLRDEPLMGLPRIYSVAWAFVAHTDGAFNEGLLTHYLSAYQEFHDLNLGEMWALPTTLRVVLVENLRRLAERVAIHKAAREVANLCSDRIETYAPHLLQDLLALLNRRGIGQVFLAQMSQRLQGHRTGEFTAIRDWLQQQMPQPALVQAQHSADQAADNLSVSNAVSSLRAISDADWSSIVSGSSALMRLMLTLPIFEAEDGTTRDQTLHRIEQLAKQTGRSELDVAHALVGFLNTASNQAATTERPSSPHHWLRGPGRSELMRTLGAKGGQRWPARAAWLWQAMRDVSGRRQRVTLWVYAGSLLLGTVGLMMWALRGHDPALTAAWSGFSRGGMAWFWTLNVALMFLPASEAVIAIINRLISESVKPQHLPRLALLGGIPAEHRVMVVIPTMLTNPASIRSVVHRLHLHHLANPEAHSQFALLGDWADASTQHTEADAPLLDEACALITELNLRYPTTQGLPARFIVLHRQRQYSHSEGAWIGWERKRGKLELLMALLAGGTLKDHAETFIDLGELSRVAPNTPYLLTLDSDTELPPGRLRELVGIAAHPSNRPQLHASGLRVSSGYGIIQPRVVTPLPSPADATLFHWLFAGQCGNDPYTAASSEVYQDLFGEGTFSGKGLLNVAAVHAVLGNRLPHSQVLSHDLLEGSLARCASATDLTVMEDAPFHADVAASRLHRWTRGDWQLLPFLLQPRRYPMRAINRWKMLDNLRRSLVSPACLALCVLMLNGGIASPKAVLALIVGAFCAGPFMGAMAGLAPSHDGIAKWYFYRNAFTEVARAVGGGLWHFSQLLTHALSSSDAVLRALWRMLVSHKQLLQWTTAASAQAAAQTELSATVRAHGLASVLAVALWAALMLTGTPHPVLTTLFCSVWALAPLGIWWVSKAPPRRAGNALTASDKTNLEAIARASWRLFERCVGPQDKHLPPDNLQTEPSEMVAHRTSPTNIGMYLLSAACARQFGWISTPDFLQRLEATLGTLDTLERHQGHFLNWYDTQTGAALLPRYVSTVDSGNLSGHLLAVAQACRDFAAHGVGNSPPPAPVWRAPKASMLTSAVELRVLDNALKEISLQNLSELELANLRTTLTDAAAWQLDDHIATLRSAATGPNASPASTAAQLRAMADRLEALAWQPDFNFLYHPSRRLLHLGWRVDERALDNSYYDLLASESRLASLIAIAKADVPAAHWAALGRPFHAVGSTASLRSWSGSMFEYLMPTLVLAEPPGSVLHNACRSAVTEQIVYGRMQKLPWGVSESAYAARDQTLAYQYAPQGVPQLALRRTPPEDQVVAPYATALAAMVAPHLAVQNFAVMAQLGATARYGFIESLDFSPSRVAEPRNPDAPHTAAGAAAFTAVSTFMAHHQGMTIVALANVLLGSVAQRWGMGHPQIQAIASLLHERPPREVPSRPELPLGLPQQALRRRAPGLLREVLPGESALTPTHVLSNGRYSVSLRANGAGQSRRNGVGINRWRDDALRDSLGSFFYVRRKAGGVSASSLASPLASSSARPLASITQHPAPDPEAQYTSTFHTDRVCFDAAWPDLRAHATVWVSPEDDIEFRQIELHNQSDEEVEIELISAFEVTLADQRADEAHPAFSNFFVSAEWRASSNALVFERRPRLEHERGLLMAHFLAFVDGVSMANRGATAQASKTVLTKVQVETDRRHWQGRNRSASQPLGQLRTGPNADAGAGAGAGSNSPAAQMLNTGLDPVCAMSVSVRIAARSQARLTFATAASENMGTLNAVVDKYREVSNVQRASLMSATLMGIRLRSLRLSTENFSAIQSLTSALVMTLASPERPATLTLSTEPDSRPIALPPVYDKRLLWRMGISGDRPLILVFAGAAQGLGLLRTLTQALRLWSWGGVACDLVVMNAEAASYQMALHREIGALRDRHAAESAADARLTDEGDGKTAAPLTALHLLRAEELSPGELSTLHGLARIVLQADGRPLVHHLQAWTERHEADFEARLNTSTTVVPVLEEAGIVSVSKGEFSSAGSANPGGFSFHVGTRQRPPRPWINVLANPDFGCHISEAGGGHTWALNSRMNQLTAWHNDPLSDPASEWLLLQDRRSGNVWSATPSVHGAANVDYEVTHTQGSTQIRHQRTDGRSTANHSASVNVTWCVDAQASVKHITVHIRNNGQRKLQWRLAAGVEWLMGATPSERRTAYTEKLRGAVVQQASAALSNASPYTALLCTQREHSGGFGGGRAFFALVPPEGVVDTDSSAGTGLGFAQALFDSAPENVVDWTCDRREFFDARGCMVLPDHFGHRSGAALDPCAALAINLDLAPGEQSTHTFLLGYISNAVLDVGAARDAVASAVRKTAAARQREVRAQWQELLGAVQVKTPDPLFDSLVNHWLLYQSIACRLWAKAGFYQAGGASGFRDQLQDAMALSWAAPEMLRAQILRCAARQYPEGDVQHWWHEPGGAGVRTHFSDDLLWLPWACAHYVNTVGDLAALDTPVPFIEGAQIPPGAEDIYETPHISTQTATVYEHAARSLDRSLAVGVHGLPLMGTGDWNDGMNRVGHAGKGESVWLAWFLCKLVADFAPIARARGETERADTWQRAAEAWKQALEAQAWDGAWYKRAFFDDGTPLGSSANSEARIDLIAQAWSVLSGAAPPERQQAAMQSARSLLIDDRSGLLHLLQPPLHAAVPSAGYIQAYPKGVRENGGQYSHGAVWALMAQAKLTLETANPSTAERDLPYRYFTYLSPAHRAANAQWGAAYEIEPYVMAGDVYGHAPYEGQGGWSWYTGAAAWMHRAAVEAIFGLKLEATDLTLTPCLPSHWNEAEISLQRNRNGLTHTMRFVLCRGTAAQWIAAHPDSAAQTLKVGQSLRWADLAGTDTHSAHCFVTELVV